VIRAADAEVTARSPAGDVVLAYIRTQVLAIARYDPLVRRDAPDAVHQMRVATRRARSAAGLRPDHRPGGDAIAG
jgi:CHAD domain-containing protein